MEDTKVIKMTTRDVNEMIRIYTKKRYAGKNERMVTKYTEMTHKM